jgi:capsular polysaccharide biosynthesis protein
MVGAECRLIARSRRQKACLSNMPIKAYLSQRSGMPLNTTRHLDPAEGPAIVSKVPYEKVVYDTLRILWARSPLIGAGLAAALALASLALVLVGPSYTARAMIQFNFIREEQATGARTVPTATVDAMAVVDSAPPIIRSHAIANAVVTRLGLDEDPAFARGSLSWRVFSSMRSLLGFEETVLSKHDLAEGQLIRRITVTIDPRSYLISISVTAADPKWAATLVNAVALEYLRGQLLQQVTDSFAAAERRMSEISSIYDFRHPAYQSEQAKLERLRIRLRALREEPFDQAVASGVTGQSFVAAQKVMIPSGPNILLVLGLTAVAELAVGTWLALQLWPNELQPTRLALLLGWRYKSRQTPPAGSSNNPRQSDTNINGKEVRATDWTARSSEQARYSERSN